MKQVAIKIGMFTVGHPVYWTQMPGIREEILGYASQIVKNLEREGEVLYAGIVDNIRDARKTEELFLRQDVDLVVIHAGTYGLSKNVIPCVRRVDAPILTVHLQPVDDFAGSSMSRDTLPKNVFSAGGELGAVLRRTGKPFHSIVGRLQGDPRPWQEIAGWCSAVKIRKRLRTCNIGLVGNFYPGMCDLYADSALLIGALGINLEILEMGDLRRLVESVSPAEVEESYQLTREAFRLDERATQENLEWCNRVAVGMDKLVRERDLDAVAFHHSGYPGSPEHRVGYSMTLGGSFLTGKGVPCVAEGDIGVAIAMLMLGSLGAGASQAEINVADFRGGVSYVSHSGPGDIGIASDKPFLRWLDFFHGKEGSGVSCEFSIRQGPVTLLSLAQDRGGVLRMIAAEGEAVPGPVLMTGNVNTRVRFSGGIEAFTEAWFAQGPTHHSAIGVGRHAVSLEKSASVLGVDWVRV